MRWLTVILVVFAPAFWLHPFINASQACHHAWVNVLVAAGSLVSATVKQQAFQSRNASAPDVGAAGIAGVSAEDESLHEAIAASLAGGEAGAARPSGAGAAGPSTRAAGESPMDADDDDDDAAIEAAIAASLEADAARAAQGGAGPSAAAGPAVIDDDGDVVDVDAAPDAAAGEQLARVSDLRVGSACTCWQCLSASLWMYRPVCSCMQSKRWLEVGYVCRASSERTRAESSRDRTLASGTASRRGGPHCPTASVRPCHAAVLPGRPRHSRV